jgi:hypothetical protein
LRHCGVPVCGLYSTVDASSFICRVGHLALIIVGQMDVSDSVRPSAGELKNGLLSITDDMEYKSHYCPPKSVRGFVQYRTGFK